MRRRTNLHGRAHRAPLTARVQAPDDDLDLEVAVRLRLPGRFAQSRHVERIGEAAELVHPERRLAGRERGHAGRVRVRRGARQVGRHERGFDRLCALRFVVEGARTGRRSNREAENQPRSELH